MESTFLDQPIEVLTEDGNDGQGGTSSLAKPRSYQRRYKNHRFNRQIRSQITLLHKLDNWHGLLLVLEDWLAIVIAISFSMWAWQNLPVVPALFVYLLAVAIIGAKQRGLRVINHTATHKALAKNKYLNYFLATVPAAWLVLESFSGYDNSHNSVSNGHHPNLGTKLDVDHMAVVRQGLYGEGRTAETVRRYLWSIPLKTLGYIMFLLKNRIWNSQEVKLERIVRLIYLAVLTTGFLYAGWGQQLSLYWIVPLLTTAIWVGAFIQLAEHYPLMEMDYEVDIYVSRNRLLNPVWNFLIGAHLEGYHQIHHLFPGLPFWRMKEAHRVLMEDEVYASLNQEKGMRALLKQIISPAKS
jgi:fatty acid desaturase